MKRTQYFLFAGFALVAMLFSNSNAMADDWDQKTVFTINQPVSVPGHVVLPAGTYVIKRVNAMTPVIQVLNKSETKVYATVFPVPDYDASASDHPIFTFQEMPEGSPVALKTWHYAGRQTGYEFIVDSK